MLFRSYYDLTSLIKFILLLLIRLFLQKISLLLPLTLLNKSYKFSFHVTIALTVWSSCSSGLYFTTQTVCSFSPSVRDLVTISLEILPNNGLTNNSSCLTYNGLSPPISSHGWSISKKIVSCIHTKRFHKKFTLLKQN